MSFWSDLAEVADHLMRALGARETDLIKRRTMIGGNPWLATQLPTRYITRHCRNDSCSTCPGPEHDLRCHHWCHMKEDDMANLFVARYDGYCRTCGEDTMEGDEIGYDSGDQLVCAECWREDQGHLGYPDVPEKNDAPRASWKDKL